MNKDGQVKTGANRSPMGGGAVNSASLEGFLQQQRTQAASQPAAVTSPPPSVTPLPTRRMGAPGQPDEPTNRSVTPIPEPKPKSWKSWVAGGVILLAILLLGLVLLRIWADRNQERQAMLDSAAGYSTTARPLNEIASAGASPLGLAVTTQGSQFTVNGQFNLNGRAVFSSTQRPVNPVAGELWFEQGDNKLWFYNGTQYLDITNAADVNNQIAALNTTLQNVVNSIQGQTGQIAVQGTVNQVNVVTNGGTITLSLPQDIAPTSSPQFASVKLGGISTQNGNAICDASNNCNYASASNALTQGGNSFGGDVVAGSLNNNGVQLITNGVERLSISSDGVIGLGGSTSDRLLVTAQVAGGTPLVFQGATDDGNTLSLVIADPTANQTIILPNASGTVCLDSGNCAGSGGYGNVLQGGNSFANTMVLGTLDNYGLNLKTNNTDRVTISNTGDIGLVGPTTTIGASSAGRLTISSQLLGGTPLVFQGATDDSFATSLIISDPTANRTIILPNADGTICLSSGNCAGSGGYGDVLQGGNNFGANMTIGTNDNFSLSLKINNVDRFTISNVGNASLFGSLGVSGDLVLGASATNRITFNGQIVGGTPLVFQGATDDSFATSIVVANPTASRTIILPNADGTICLSSGNCAGSGGYGDVLQGGNNFSATMVLGTNDDNNLQLKTNNIVRVTVSKNGNIGIGEAGPTSRLVVRSDTAGDGIRITGSGSKLLALQRFGSLEGQLVSSSDQLYINAPAGAGIVTTFDLATGNVGIGNSSPGARLHVLNSVANTIATIVQGAAGQTANLQEWRDSNNVAMTVVDALGRLGIGTSSPTSMLTVNGDLSFVPSATYAGSIQGRFNGDISGNGMGTFFQTNTTNGDTIISVKPNGTGAVSGTRYHLNSGFGEVTYSASAFDISTHRNSATPGSQPITFSLKEPSGGKVERMRIMSNGNVGIGTTAPAYLLDVAGTANATTLYQNGNQVCDTSGNCSGSGGYGNVLQGGNSFATTMVLGTNDNNALAFETNGTSYFTLTTAGVLQGSNGATISVPGTGTNSEQFGLGASATGASSLAVGNGASASGSNATAIGLNASAGYLRSTAVGASATTGNQDTVAIGHGASAAHIYSIVIGRGAASVGDTSVSIGQEASASNKSIALGANAVAGQSNSIAIGRQAATTANNQLVIGSTGAAISQGYIGNGVTAAAPQSFTLNGTGGSGTDIAGANLLFAGGRGTGTGAGGDIILQTAAAGGTTGSSLNALTERMRITSAGNVGIGVASPTSRLTVLQEIEIANSGNNRSALKIGRSGSGAASSAVEFYTAGVLQASLATSNVSFALLSTGSESVWLGNTSNGSGNIYLTTNGIQTGGSSNYLGIVSNELVRRIGNTTFLRLAADGKFALGNAAPTSKLDVSGNAAIGSGYAGVTAAPTDGLIVEGNVGIGTGSPSVRLHVVASNDTAATFNSGNITGSGNIVNIQGSLLRGSTNSTYGGALSVAASIAPTSGQTNLSFIDINGTINQTGSATGITRGVYVRPTLTAAADFRGVELANNSGFGVYQGGASATNYFAGNVGIGTSTPTNLLTLSSATSPVIEINPGSSTTANPTIKLTDTAANPALGAEFFYDNQSGGAGIKVLGQKSFGISVNTYASPARIFNINNTGQTTIGGTSAYQDFNVLGSSYFSGNVGIGMTAPQARLYVVAGGSGGIGQIIQGASGQTANLQEWRDSSGSVLSYVGATGSFRAPLAQLDALGIGITASGNYGIRSVGGSTGSAYFAVTNSGRIPLTLRGAASQTANLQEWQNDTGAVLASISAGGNLTVVNATVTGTLTVTGAAVFNNTLTVNGHIITGNTSGSTTASAGAGAGAGANVVIDGNDTAGTITITTGTGVTAGEAAAVAFANAYGAAPRVVISPDNAAAGALDYNTASRTVNGFSIEASGMTDGATYVFNYFIAQ